MQLDGVLVQSPVTVVKSLCPVPETAPNRSAVPPVSAPNTIFRARLGSPSSLPGSHLTLEGRIRSGHTSQIPRGHGPEKAACR